jgi:YVTN family beta-propeller protein
LYSAATTAISTATGHHHGDGHTAAHGAHRSLNRAFVANTASDTVSMRDTKTGAVLRAILVGRPPTALLGNQVNERFIP